MYNAGKGVAQDYAEVVRYCRKGADQGDATAQSCMGFSYFHGRGVAQDYGESVRWYRKAADQGLANAQYALGYMYHRGYGVPRDHAEAVRWFRKAADQGDVTAQSYLGVRYFSLQFGRVVASCFAKTQRGPLARWTLLLSILLALPMLLVPQRGWGRAAWVPWALLSAACATGLVHSLARVLPGTIFSGFGQVLWLSLLAASSASCAILAVVQAGRGSERAALGAAREETR
jgi:hypothetical protein